MSDLELTWKDYLLHREVLRRTNWNWIVKNLKYFFLLVFVDATFLSIIVVHAVVLNILALVLALAFLLLIFVSGLHLIEVLAPYAFLPRFLRERPVEGLGVDFEILVWESFLFAEIANVYLLSFPYVVLSFWELVVVLLLPFTFLLSLLSDEIWN